MILLDTNVLSELIRPRPDERVLTWIGGVPAQTLATTAITAAELLAGVAMLPDGRRKTELRQAVEALLREDLEGRVEPFDLAAAVCFARICADRARIGRPISPSDGKIAAICQSTGAVLATRNTVDFENTGIGIVNPWD